MLKSLSTSSTQYQTFWLQFSSAFQKSLKLPDVSVLSAAGAPHHEVGEELLF
ncbi:MAG: hypothetical protein WC107_01315 [Patescibacteria group bacterium]